MRKSLEQRRENPPRAFVPELELPIESLVRTRHQELGRRQGARGHVAEEVPEVHVGPRGTALAARCPPGAPGSLRLRVAGSSPASGVPPPPQPPQRFPDSVRCARALIFYTATRAAAGRPAARSEVRTVSSRKRGHRKMSHRRSHAAVRQPNRAEPAQTPAEELRHALTLLAEAERIAQIGSWEWDVRSDTVRWSDELCRMLGVQPGAFGATFKGAMALGHPHDHDLLSQTIERAYRDRAPYVCDHRVVRSDGTVRFFHSRGTVVVDDTGAPVKIVGTAQDVTERKQAEDALARYAAIIESSEDAIITNALDGTILSWNPGAERLYGYWAKEVEGHPFSILIPTNGREEWTQILDRVRCGEHVEHHETARLHRDGHRVHVSVSVSPIKDPAGRVVGASSIAHDITDLRQAAEALARSRAQLRAFAGRLRSARETERSQIAREIHDELGQALTALKMDLYSLNHGVPQPLKSKADGMAALIDQMVDKVRTLAADLRPAVLDNLGLVAAVEWAARQFDRRTGIPCSLDMPPEQICLDLERSPHIFRILQEALTNIARHAGATQVDIRLRDTPCEVVLEVHDNGRGITESESVDAHSFGLLGMRERALSWGGDVGVCAAPQGGTSVTACIPLGHGRPGAVA